MKITLVSFGGSAINDGTVYHSKLLNPGMGETEPLILERQNYLPVYGGKRHQGKALHLLVDANPGRTSDASGSVVANRMGTIGAIFDIYSETMGTLLAQDAAGNNKQWYVMATPYSMPEWSGNLSEIMLMTADPVWRSVAQGTATYSGTAAVGTITATVGGNQPAYPVIAVRPSAAKTGSYAYRRYVTAYNRTDEEIRGEAWNLTDNGSGTACWNTAAAVSGGTIQADGDDITVYCDNVEIPRWLGDVGGTTRIWAAIPFAPRIEFTISAITTTAAITTITVEPKNANLKAVQRLPDQGKILIESEIFSYTAKKCPNKKKITLTVGQRAIRGTTAATHAASTTARWIEHDIWILYGNASAAAPETDDSEQPLFTLATSNNLSRVYTTFADLTGKRTGQWQPAVIQSTGNKSYTYTAHQDGDAVDPATEMGIAIKAWQKGTRWQAEDAKIEWRYYCPFGITQIIANGDKYRVSSSWPTVGLQKAHYPNLWAANSWTATTPTNAGSWTTWAGTVALGGTFEYIRFLLDDAISGSSSNAAYFEVDDITLSLGGNVPYVSMGAIESNYLLDGSITNNTTGEVLYITYTMAIHNTLTVNTDMRTVTYADATNALGARRLDAVRTDWLKLVPGANQLVFSDPGWTGGTITVTWEDRSTI